MNEVALYFACKWLIKLNNISLMRELSEKAAELGRTVVILNIIENQEDYSYITFGIQCASRQQLDRLIEEIGNPASLSDWYLVNEAEFLQGSKLAELLMQDHNLMIWLRSIFGLAHHNEFWDQVNASPHRLYYDVPMENLNLSIGTFNSLRRFGYTAVGDIVEKLKMDPESLLNVRNIDRAALAEIIEKVEAKGYWFSNKKDSKKDCL